MAKKFYNKRHKELYAKFVELKNTLKGSRLSTEELEEYLELEKKTVKEKEKKKEIEKLYDNIFTRNATVFPHVILTEEGAIKLLDKINEIVNCLNKISSKTNK